MTGTFDQASLPIPLTLSVATGISLWLPSFLFPSSLDHCLHKAGSSPHLQLDGFEACPLSSSHKQRIWHTSSALIVDGRWMANDAKPTDSITALTMCTTLHPSPFYRGLNLPLRDRHIIPNRTWSASPSPTSQRRMVPPCGL